MKNNVQIVNKGYSQDVVLTIDGISKIIYHLNNYDIDYYCDFISDENYIIVYTIRIVDYEDPMYMTRFKNVVSVYDCNTNETLDLSQDTLYRIKEMYLTKGCFPIEVVLSLLTNHYFTSDKSLVAYFKNYITGFNENITDDEIKSYLIKCYPELANLEKIKLLFLNRKKINKLFGGNTLSFHSMKQDIKEYNNYLVEKDKQFRKKYNSY